MKSPRRTRIGEPTVPLQVPPTEVEGGAVHVKPSASGTAERLLEGVVELVQVGHVRCARGQTHSETAGAKWAEGRWVRGAVANGRPPPQAAVTTDRDSG